MSFVLGLSRQLPLLTLYEMCWTTQTIIELQMICQILLFSLCTIVLASTVGSCSDKKRINFVLVLRVYPPRSFKVDECDHINNSVHYLCFEISNSGTGRWHREELSCTVECLYGQSSPCRSTCAPYRSDDLAFGTHCFWMWDICTGRLGAE